MLTDELWTSSYNSIYGYFARRVTNRHDVENLTAETLETYFLHTDEAKWNTGYLFGIARNTLNQFLRVKYNNKEIATLDGLQNDYVSPEHKAFLNRLFECVKHHLSDQDRQIVEMCIQYDFSSKEVAESLTITADNARQRLKRALEKLKVHCTDYWSTTTNHQ
jgi:RNA polymerase sigma-70 factor, ECF subfamily